MVHVCHDERSAGFVALGIGRATDMPAVVVTTSGTAVANLAPAATEADAAGVPLLLLTADRPAELHDVGANQTLRQAELLRAVVRWHVDLPAAAGHASEPSWWRSTMCRAVATARGVAGATLAQSGTGSGAGAVHLNTAFREPTVPGLDDGRSTVTAYAHATTGRPDGAPWTALAAAPPNIGAVVTDLAARLQGRRVLVVAGDVTTPMPALDDLPWPVVAEPTAGASLATGVAHGSLLVGSRSWRDRHRPDVVVRLGHPTLSRGALVGLADVPTIQVTAGGLVDPARHVATAFTADPAAVVDGLASTVAATPASREWQALWQAGSDRAGRVVADVTADAPSLEPAVATVAAAAVGNRSLVVASSTPIRDVADFAANPATGRVYANRGLAGIDGFTSTAVGIAIANGPTVALAGDLSFLHDHNGLLVAAAEQPPLVIVVVDNDGGGLFHHVPARDVAEFEQLFATPHGRDLVAIAQAAGLPARRVDAGVLHDAVADSHGPEVLVVRTDRHASATARRRIAAKIDAW